MKREYLNKILLLELVQVGKGVGERTLINLVFILQNEGRNEKRMTFNYEFEKWRYVTYSAELERDVEHLLTEKWIEKKDGSLYISETGLKMLNHERNIVEQSKVDHFFKFFCYSFQKYTFYDLSNYIFQKYGLAKFSDNEKIVCVEPFEVCKSKGTVSLCGGNVFNLSQNTELEKEDEICLEKVNKMLDRFRNAARMEKERQKRKVNFNPR